MPDQGTRSLFLLFGFRFERELLEPAFLSDLHQLLHGSGGHFAVRSNDDGHRGRIDILRFGDQRFVIQRLTEVFDEEDV